MYHFQKNSFSIVINFEFSFTVIQKKKKKIVILRNKNKLSIVRLEKSSTISMYYSKIIN